MSEAAAADAVPSDDGTNPWAVTGVVMLGMMMSIIDASIVNVSVPHMMGTFGASVSEISWVVTAYTLANVILIPLSAWLGSVVGRSRLYGLAISVFTVASVLCGLAPSLPALIAARVAQGAAAGILMPTGQAILYESFPPEKRGSSMAVFGLGVMVGPAVGPTLGGWITDNYGWPWIFFINLPIGLIGAALVPMFLRDPAYLRRRDSARGDLVGIVLLATGIATVQYVLEYGEDAGWFGADWIVIATTLAVVVLAGFVVWELDHPDPAVDLRVFADPSFRAAALVNVAIGVGLMGGMFMLPLFLQQLIGFSATQSGLVLVPGALATAVAMPICGRLSDRSDPRLLSGFGLIVFAASMVMMSRLDSRAGQADLLIPQILRGIGMGFCFVPLSVAAMARIPRERMGQATGLFNLTRQVGGSLGVAWLASLVGRFREGHQANLVGYVTPYSDNVRETMHTVASALMARGVAVDPNGLAGYVLYGRVMKASAELAFRDMFLVIVALFVASLPLLLFLQRREPGTGPAPAVAHAE
ncbi:MAG: DHA2 family efflux MFS transporter permease subunit [Myxococcales bacterium]|nr:DHA2 family efflux MFS transporter permease subunit [Myxococcales bacterium]